jgi:YVTN family beta-propeller protein
MKTDRFAARAKASLALLLLATVAASPAGGFKVVRRLPLGGEGGWDYIVADAASHRLFVTRGTRVTVVDMRTDSAAGEVPNTAGVHGVALAPELSRGFTSNGRDSSVTVFDLKTLATIANVKLPARNPDAIVYDPASGRVFTMNGGSGNATAIDARTNAIAGTVALGGRPEFAAVDGAGKLFVNLEDSSAIVAVDTRKLQVLARWPIAPGEEPTGLALDRAHGRLFSGCGNRKLVVVDAAKGAVIDTLPIGQGVDAVAWDPARALVFSSNGEGTLSVFHQDTPDRYSAVETATTERGARTLALDESTGTLYLPTADFGPPPPATPDRPHPRPSIVPGSFRVLVVKR